MIIASQRGSALFIILIAVALFAALSYAVSDMLRGGNAEKIGEEKAAIMAGEILDYADQITQAVQNIRISNGCTDTDISFENTTVAGYTNGTNTQCQVFHTDGGLLRYIAPESKWLDQNPLAVAEPEYGKLEFDGRGCVPGVGNGSGACWLDGQDNEDLIFYIPFVKQEICLAINDKLGITATPGAIPVDKGCGWAFKFTGTYTETLAIASNVAPTAANDPLYGHKTGCYKALAADCNWLPDSYHFYAVLIPR